MDPFSITVGAIGLAGAANKATGSAIKRLKALRDAPEELRDLLAELSQFELVLQRIQNAADPSEIAHSPLENVLGTARDKILELHWLIEYRLTKAWTSSEVDRSQWAGSQKDVDRLRKQLTNIRANLHVNLSINTNITVENTWGLLRQVHQENHAMQQMAAFLIQEVQSTSSAVTGILNKFPHVTLESFRSDLQSVPGTAHGSSLIQTGIPITYGGSSRQLQPQRTYKDRHCCSNCPCECHHIYRSSSPWLLTRLCGRVCIERKGSSSVGASHHIQSCKASAVSQIRVIYFVPTWFAMKAYDIRYTSSPLHGPEWLIKIPRLVSHRGNRGFEAIYKGDLPMFRSAIASGECTPYDVYENGGSMLWQVMWLQRFDIMGHLVGMGVDLCQPMGTDAYLLWSIWYRLVEDPPTKFMRHGSLFLPKLIPSFPFDEYSEIRGFTLLHEIVCHISGRDLDSALQTHQADVNKLNKDGYSPLELAIKRRDVAAVRILLKRGADPNINNGTPMFSALNNTSLVVVDLLLRSGAIVHGPAGDRAAKTWMDHHWITNKDDPEKLAIDRLLIEYGIGVNRQVLGRTIVMALCHRRFGWYEKKSHRMEQLIDLGADLELRNAEGYTALHVAVCANNRKAIKTLLRSGARIDDKTNEGNTLAHLAVLCSREIKMAKAISEMGLRRIDLDLKNDDGHTVYDLLRKRNGLRWEKFYSEWRERRVNGSHNKDWTYPFGSRAREDEYGTILALEALLHHIQDLQGISKDQQYPPLGEYLSDDKDEDLVPGAWPV